MGIVLAGVDINELMKQKTLIQKDATKFLSDGIERVKVLVNEMVELDTEEDQDTINEKAREAVDILGNVQLVSNVSGVEYYLPHHDECGYASGGTPMFSLLEDAGIEGTDVDDLYGLLEDMQSNVMHWNRSYC